MELRSGHSARESTSRTGFLVQRVAAVFFAFVIALYFGLIGSGQWQADEYADFADVAQNGPRALLSRLAWSPRPLSEPLLFVYGWIVRQLHRPLIAPFLGILWGGLLLAALLTWWQNRREGHRAWPVLLAGLGLTAYILTSGPLMEVFYWPAGAVAYLPTLSASLLLFLQAAYGRLSTREDRFLGCICLLVAGCSSETGAIFSVCFAFVQAVWFLSRRARSSGVAAWRVPALWWLLPGALSAVLLVAARFNRYYVVERPAPIASPIAGQWCSSLFAGAKTLLLEAAGQSAHSWHGIGLRLLAEVFLALGITVYLSQWSRLRESDRGQLIGLSSALLLASLLTAAASYVHFGGLCCERHEVLRRAWIAMSLCGLSLAALNPFFTSRWLGKNVVRVGGTFLLCLSVAIPWHAGTLIRQYRLYPAMRYATSHNFSSGFAPARDMVFLLPPDTALILGEKVAPGRYTLESPERTLPHYLLRFFHKDSVLVRAPSEWMPDLQPSKKDKDQ